MPTLVAAYNIEEITRSLCASLEEVSKSFIMAKKELNVAFAFSPAQAVQGLLDYTKCKHSKIYKSAIREVCKEPFECKADGLYQFLKDF